MSAHPLHGRRHRGPQIVHGWTPERVERVIAAVLNVHPEGPLLERAARDFRGTHYLRMSDAHHDDIDAWATTRGSDAPQFLADYLNRHNVPIPEDGP